MDRAAGLRCIQRNDLLLLRALRTLFLGWTALLGLSIFEAVVTAGTVDRAALNPLLALTASRILAWVLIAAAVTFAVLWLKEIVPDVLDGRA